MERINQQEVMANENNALCSCTPACVQSKKKEGREIDDPLTAAGVAVAGADVDTGNGLA